MAAEVSKGIANVAIETGVPISFGVLTTDTLEQAIERAGAKSGNKGWDAAVAAIEIGQSHKADAGLIPFAHRAANIDVKLILFNQVSSFIC